MHVLTICHSLSSVRCLMGLITASPHFLSLLFSLFSWGRKSFKRPVTILSSLSLYLLPFFHRIIKLHLAFLQAFLESTSYLASELSKRCVAVYSSTQFKNSSRPLEAQGQSCHTSLSPSLLLMAPMFHPRVDFLWPSLAPWWEGFWCETPFLQHVLWAERDSYFCSSERSVWETESSSTG